MFYKEGALKKETTLIQIIFNKFLTYIDYKLMWFYLFLNSTELEKSYFFTFYKNSLYHQYYLRPTNPIASSK